MKLTESKIPMICKNIIGIFFSDKLSDAAQRLIFTQDGEQRLRGEWFFSIPDVLERTVITGTCTNSFSIGEITASAITATLNNGAYKGYSVSGCQLYNAVVYTADYYELLISFSQVVFYIIHNISKLYCIFDFCKTMINRGFMKILVLSG